MAQCFGGSDGDSKYTLRMPQMPEIPNWEFMVPGVSDPKEYYFEEDKVENEKIYRDVCIMVEKLDHTATDARKIKIKRDKMYMKLRANGLDIRVRQGSPEGEFKDTVFLLLGAGTSRLRMTADTMGLEKRLADEHKDLSVPIEDYRGYAEYSNVTSSIFEPGMETYFTSLERQRMIYHIIESPGPNSLDLDRLVADGVIKDYFSIDSVKGKHNLIENWVNASIFKKAPLDDIRDYYGEKIAFYFAWIRTYTQWLGYLSLLAVIIFAIQAALTFTRSPLTVDNEAVPVYAVCVALWCTGFSEAWKRKQNTLAFVWNVQDFEEEELPRPEFVQMARKAPPPGKEPKVQKKKGVFSKGRFVEVDETLVDKPPVNLVFDHRTYMQRVAVGIGITLVMMACAILGTLGIMAAKLIITRTWNETAGPFVGSLINSAFITVMNFAWRYLSPIINSWESHRTDTEYEDALIVKTFAFQFINSYISLFYIAYIQGTKVQLFGLEEGNEPLRDSCPQDDCMNYLFVQLFVILTIQQIGRFIAAIAPLLYGKYRQNELKKQDTDNTTSQLERIELEATLAAYPGTFEEYAELTIQFGYVTMFAVAFPLGAAICFVNNVIERKWDATKLVLLSRRPRYRGAEDIGTWEAIINIIGIIAVVTNVLLMLLTSNTVRVNLFAWGGPVGGILLVFLAEHCMFAAKAGIAYLVPDEPFWVTAAKVRHDIYLLELERKLRHITNPAPKYQTEIDDDLSNDEEAPVRFDEAQEDGSDVDLDDKYDLKAKVLVNSFRV
mmetsp:Transcript_13493/g.39828  ORF Transcript_13493/g.39828 Transcript_13493/m.39828 type:complete len:778 (+) Transcript_13493:57-2390(+)